MGGSIMPKCYFCHKEVSEDDYCFGCDDYVCEKCDENQTKAVGDHLVEDHKD